MVVYFDQEYKENDADIEVAIPITGRIEVDAGALIWIAGYLTVVYAADIVLFALESMPFLKIILNQSYTKRFRRYLAPGYDPLNDSCRQAAAVKNARK